MTDNIAEAKRLAELEMKLANYAGEDKVISISEMKELLAKRPKNKVNFRTGIPSLDGMVDGCRGGELVALSGPPKNGKCMKKGTKLLMFDGTIKNIEDIKIGDKLMGDDSTPRTVLTTCNGIDKLYKIIPCQGIPYSVNGEHILCLMRGPTTNRKADNLRNTIREISVNDYIKLSNNQKHMLKTYRVPVKFEEKPLDFDPYLLGLWLGDGSSNTPEITTADKEIVDYLYSFAEKYNFKITMRKFNEPNKSSLYRISEITQRGRIGRKNTNRFKEFLKYNNLLSNKHIPYNYKCNSEENRLKLLAGLIDTDGNYIRSSRGGAVEFVNKSEQLINDVAYLARSLGFSCTPRKTIKKIKSIGFEGEYWHIRIGGDTSRIPCLLKRKNRNGMPTFRNVLRAAFKIEDDGIGEYYGFMLDGNGRYLLSDFQVTHNTLLAQTLTVKFAEQGIKSLWMSFEVPIEQFITQMPDMVEYYIPSLLVAKNPDWLEERILEAKIKYDVRAVFIDHLHFIIDLARGHSVSIDIGAVVRKLKIAAIKYNVVIFLLCHMTKQQFVPNSNGKSEEQEPGSEGIRDSSFVAQEADTTWVIWRRKDKETGEYNNNATIKICNHRRTGVMEKKAKLVKRGFLFEQFDNETPTVTSAEMADYHEKTEAKNEQPTFEDVPF